MATIKSYTDIEQSKKLAEILPIESADMYYFLDPTPAGNIYHIVTTQIDFGVKTREPEYNKGDIPCWSLAALLDVLPKTFNYNNHTYQFMYNTHAMYYINVDNYDEDTFCSTNKNLVDACYELILKLNELNLLSLWIMKRNTKKL